MMTDSVFVKENIFINEEPISDKMALFKYISENAKHLNYVLSEQDCFDGLVDRESQQTTGFQDGFAIPQEVSIPAPPLIRSSCSVPWSRSRTY